MITNAQNDPVVETPKKSISVKVFGVGGAGINVMELMLKERLPGVGFVAVDTDAPIARGLLRSGKGQPGNAAPARAGHRR